MTTEALYDSYHRFKGYAAERRLARKDVARLTAALWRPAKCDRSMRFLELGCGTGSALSYLAHMGVTAFTGVDIDPALVRAMPEPIRDHFVNSDLREYLTGQAAGSVERVFALDVLEHFAVHEVLKLVGEVDRVLTPSGAFLVRVPNAGSPFGGQHQAGDLTHKTAFAPNALRQIAAHHGLKVTLYGAPPPTTRRRRITSAAILRAASWLLAEPPEFWQANLCAIFWKAPSCSIERQQQ